MIQFEKIIKTVNDKIEDFFICDCLFDDLNSFLLSFEKMTYNDIISELGKRKPKGFFFLEFYDSSVLICKDSFLYYQKIRKSRFLKEQCCQTFLDIGGELIAVCYICFIKDILSNFNLNFFIHFRLANRFRNNGLYSYLQLPTGVSTEKTLL